MGEQFNVDLPPRFTFSGTTQEERDAQLTEYLNRLSVQIEDMFKRLFNRYLTSPAIAQALVDSAQAITDIAEIEGTIDGLVITYYGAEAPTEQSVGDLWIDATNGNVLKRWNGDEWIVIQDEDVAQAIADAGNAQATADGKIYTFYQASIPTSLGVGDLWVDTDNSNKLYRAESVGADAIASGEWVLVNVATSATNIQAGTISTVVNVGEDNVVIDGPNSVIKILDDEDNVRVRVGKLS